MSSDEAAQAASADHSWGIALLVPAAQAPRNRRPIEVALVAAGALGAGLTAVVVRSAPEVDVRVVGVLLERRLPRAPLS